MKIISHRGNVSGPDLNNENNPNYIDRCINLGFDVEIDLRSIDNKLYLGHDNPQYNISLSWLNDRKNFIWIHCKNFESINFLSNTDIKFNYFWHQNDDYTLTSFGYIWTYPGKKYSNKSIIVMPEWNIEINNLPIIKDYNCFGICSDYIQIIFN